ncbi:MAG: lysozyme family protein [Ethanoligenens sp.]
MDTVRKSHRLLRVVPMAVTTCLLVSVFVTPLHVPADSIPDLQNQYAQLQKQQGQLLNQISSQSSAIQTGQTQLTALNASINVTKQQIALLQAQVDATNAEIQQKDNEMTATKVQLDYAMDQLKKRLRALYESGHDTFLEVLLSSNSISDFLTRTEIVRAVSDHDQRLIDKLQQAQNQLQADQLALKNTQQSLLATQGQMAAKQDILNAQVDQQAQMVVKAQANVQAEQQQAAAVTAQQAQVNTQITAAFAEQAAAARAAAAKTSASVSNSGTVGGGVFSSSVLAYQGTVTQVAAQYGMSNYVNLILAVMQQESDGEGNDPMQALGGSGASATPMDSIVCGIQELKQDIQIAGCTGPTDIANIELALQGYNFGSGFIAWVRGNGGYSVANALKYSKMQAAQLGWSGYGDPYYVPHVLRYYSPS